MSQQTIALTGGLAFIFIAVAAGAAVNSRWISFGPLRSWARIVLAIFGMALCVPFVTDFWRTSMPSVDKATFRNLNVRNTLTIGDDWVVQLNRDKDRGEELIIGRGPRGHSEPSNYFRIGKDGSFGKVP